MKGRFGMCPEHIR